MMYFSGVASPVEAEILREAGVEHVLADPQDWIHLEGFRHRVLDSGAYRAWKSDALLDVAAYLRFAETAGADWHVAPDVIGDAAASRENWVAHRRPGMIPVWGLPDGDTNELAAYLNESEIVGIGGIAKAMHEKHRPTLNRLQKLAEQHPGRFHVFGLNWPLAISRLNDLLASHASSTWLKAARYGHVFFVHTKTGNIQSAPAGILGMKDLSRRERLVHSARVLDEYCNGAGALQAETGS